MKSLTRILPLLWLWLCLSPAVSAQELTIEITQGVEGAVPIAIVPFGWQGAGAPPEDIAAVVSADLARSGRFDPLGPTRYLDRPTSLEQVNFSNWRSLRSDYVAVGSIAPQPGGGYTIRVQLADVFQGQELLTYVFDVNNGQLRRAAHHISDLIYERITGQKGAFDTLIAYVTSQRRFQPGQSPNYRYELVVADSDGRNPRVIVSSEQPLMSPAWSPDGTRLAYVSFEGRRAQIVVQDVYSGNRQVVSDSPGINGAPAWAPNGRQLAMTLSRDGNPEIYVMDLVNRTPVRLTSNSGIDTEPVWSEDGRYIIFTSDRGGNPQLYRVPAGGGQAERLTFEGDYNSNADSAPGREDLALVHRSGGRFHIATFQPASRRLQVLTDGGLDESPSFAPNGQMILYATTRSGQGVLSVVSVDGRIQQNLVSRDSDVRDPAWSPYLR